MNLLLEAYAAIHAGFGLLAHNYAQCSSTEILQMSLIAVAAACAGRIGLRSAASERMRRRLDRVDLRSEPALSAALDQANRIVSLRRPIDCYWANDGELQLAALGYIRPCLIVGRQIPEALAPAELEAALAHEMLHVRRKDALRADLAHAFFTLGALAAGFALLLFLAFYVGAFTMDRLLALLTVAGGLLFVTTGGRSVSRWLERQAEFACDRAAAAGRGGTLAAAAALVKVARLEKSIAPRGMAAAMPLFSAETFHLRMRRLIDADQSGTTRGKNRYGWRAAGAAVFALPALALAQPVDMQDAAASGCVTCGLVLKKSMHWNG